jgi:hypothetical protein
VKLPAEDEVVKEFLSETSTAVKGDPDTMVLYDAMVRASIKSYAQGNYVKINGAGGKTLTNLRNVFGKEGSYYYRDNDSVEAILKKCKADGNYNKRLLMIATWDDHARTIRVEQGKVLDINPYYPDRPVVMKFNDACKKIEHFWVLELPDIPK